MASSRKIAANRANARKSTGPKTQRGKSHTALNAISYGFYAATRLLPYEDEAEYRRLVDEVLADVMPEGPIEHALTKRVISDIWQLGRIDRGEKAHYKNNIASHAAARRRQASHCENPPGLFASFLESQVPKRMANFPPKREDVDSALADAVSNLQNVQLLTKVDGLLQCVMKKNLPDPRGPRSDATQSTSRSLADESVQVSG
jgi:hypothetical protein